MSKQTGEMSVRQAERIIEIFENGSKNGKEWAHDVCLHRGTEKYEKSIDTLNQAFRLKSMNIIIQPLKEPVRPIKPLKDPVRLPGSSPSKSLKSRQGRSAATRAFRSDASPERRDGKEIAK
jgi:hypothetical protein